MKRWILLLGLIAAAALYLLVTADHAAPATLESAARQPVPQLDS